MLNPVITDGKEGTQLEKQINNTAEPVQLLFSGSTVTTLYFV